MASTLAGTEQRSAARPLAVVRRLVRTPHLMAALTGALAATLVFLAAHASLIDDAYITADYARSLAYRGTWGLEPGLTSNTATSPLNVLFLAALTLLTGSPIVAIGVAFVAAETIVMAAASAIAVHIGAHRLVFLTATLLLGLNPLLLSTIGLETVLAVALVAALGWAVVSGRAALAGLICGLLAVTRADLAVLVLPGLALAVRQRPLAALAAAAAPVLPWYAASWFLLGSAVPDTSLLKVGDQWGPWSYANGLLLYFRVYPAATLLALLPLVLLLAAPTLLERNGGSGKSRRLLVVWGLGGALSVITYLALHPAPYHWYYGPALGALVLLGAAGTSCLTPRIRHVGLVLTTLIALVTVGFLGQRSWTTAPITTNWASARQYAAAAALVPSGAVIRSPGEIGTLAFFCDCTVVDEFSDRGLLQRRITQALTTASSARAEILKINYAHLVPVDPVHPTLAFEFADGPGPGIATSTPWRPQGHLRVVPLPTP